MKKFRILFLTVLFTLLLSGTTAAEAVASGDAWSLDADGRLVITGAVAETGEGGFDSYPWSPYYPQIKTVYIENDVPYIPDFSFLSCTELESITVEEGSSAYLSDDGVLYKILPRERLLLLNYPDKKPDEEYTLPDNADIYTSAFANAAYLKKVTLAEGTYEIWDAAFQNCTALEEVLPYDSYCVSCRTSAFEGCVSMNPVRIDLLCWDDIFTDLTPGSRYYAGCKFVGKHGIMNGMGAEEFSPKRPMTRAMFVTVFGRMAGLVAESAEEAPAFTDVEPGQWYTPYVNWAADVGLLRGYGDGTFGVNDNVTVEQAALIFARYDGMTEAPLYDLEGDFADADEISDWAMDAMRWAVAEGLWEGEDGRLCPKKEASREEVANMIYRYAERNPRKVTKYER